MFHVKHEILKKALSKEEGGLVQDLYHQHQVKLEEYLSLLLWWNEKINLVSRNVPRETLKKHIEHSLTISLLKSIDKAMVVIDAGTGGGLPGIPLAIAHPQKEYVLNDIVSKKIMAVKQIAHKLKLPPTLIKEACSVQDLEMKEGAVLVSKHAFKVNELWEMVKEKPWQTIILLKGSSEVERELEGITKPLQISIVDLEPGFGDSFYKGKALVEIKRQ